MVIKNVLFNLSEIFRAQRKKMTEWNNECPITPHIILMIRVSELCERHIILSKIYLILRLKYIPWSDHIPKIYAGWKSRTILHSYFIFCSCMYFKTSQLFLSGTCKNVSINFLHLCRYRKPFWYICCFSVKRTIFFQVYGTKANNHELIVQFWELSLSYIFILFQIAQLWSQICLVFVCFMYFC